ncbi:helix-turn-helix domain-containing protein [Actinokineospora fastidiosa]|uniref:HTH cro/C1-type domain-containing protein n=1 Tax=Actinokineospora fastidiosa TaxID=1816 RepID=A0A918GCF7_9PSEU|nr:helix-turn-helix transcriptional regulator [Actinokineospora fastidiosa]GGS28279.1 hypothetical protein GCM10010171_21550 [Actinokineospora fastidiosa]
MARESAAVAGLRRELGERLALCRKAAGMTQAQLAAAVFCDRSRLAHLEKGRGSADERFWRAADEALQAGGVLVRTVLEFRAALTEQENHLREVELATIRERIAAWEGSRQAMQEVTEPFPPAAIGGDLTAAMEWLDARVGWTPGTARLRVSDWINGSRGRLMRDAGCRGRVGRERLAVELARYYGGEGLFTGAFGEIATRTSILTRPEWLEVGGELTADRDQLQLVLGNGSAPRLTERNVDAAVRRLAEAEIGQVRIADAPIYRLLRTNVGHERIAGEVEVASFIEYALTADLLESELVDAIGAGRPARPGSLLLRDAQLPDRAAVLDVGNRLCAGGVLALTAIARPAEVHRGPADYVVLVQRRSGQVLNAGGRLAVIPKGFHGPMVDYRGDARIGATLLRELEEELFGRADVDSTTGPQRAAAPMHPSRLSDPMRWLTEVPGRMRLDFTGFGLNLVSGNYEFAGLVVVEDEEFWARFGGAIEANWETIGLRQFSTLDHAALAELVRDQGWSNEGLFALLLGLRRLTETGKDRVDLPEIGWELQ